MSGLKLHKTKVTCIEIQNNKIRCRCDSCHVVCDNMIISCNDCAYLSSIDFIDFKKDTRMKTFSSLKELIIINSKEKNLYVPNDLVSLILIDCRKIKTVYVNSKRLDKVFFKNCKELSKFYFCSGAFENYDKIFTINDCPNFNTSCVMRMELDDVPTVHKFLKLISGSKKFKIKELLNFLEQLNKQLLEINNELKECLNK